jgi:hypothetical protein
LRGTAMWDPWHTSLTVKLYAEACA